MDDIVLCCCLAGATTLFALGNSLFALGLARFLQGFASNGVWVLGMSLVADFYRDDNENLGSAMAIIMGGYSLGQVIGPPAGGQLYKISRAAPFLLCAALLVVDVTFLLMLVEAMPTPFPEEGELGKYVEAPVETSSNIGNSTLRIESTNSGKELDPMINKPELKPLAAKTTNLRLRDLLKFDRLWTVLFLNLILSIVQNGIEPTLPYRLEYLYHMDAEAVGLVWISLMLPLVLGGFVGGYMFDKAGMRRTFLISFSACSISLFVLAIPGPVRLEYTCMTLGLMGFSLGMAVVPISPAIVAAVPHKYVTMAYSLMTIVWALGICVGPILASFIYDKLGWTWQYIIFGIMCCISTLYSALIGYKALSNSIVASILSPSISNLGGLKR
ncbi:MFS general substrate transporter [Rhizoclosmatium globosum]|uniref:MFS general substrate transporter n=1 Tax=Rhizoclosmatium globosum TaxID=329046 RepID=A0A1Y2CB75_9FUNG|nr:MFS general substrate transporter [Rhizoclosmatium globosum]|eukprot:ORY44147.1 MFS general substrate transporter [Rhizoclosmatium globosum]